MNLPYILQRIPFFNHLTSDEIQKLSGIAEVKYVQKNERIDIKKIKSFGTVLDGMFELGPLVKGEIAYLAPGSFFGEIPFALSHHTGSIKAARDSAIALINPAEMYKLFLTSFKGMRGYIRNIKTNGFDVTDAGNDFLNRGSKVITVLSQHHNSGNSLFAAALGIILSAQAPSVILDASYNGNSVFNIFEKDIPPAISQKSDENASVFERVINVSENLSMLNILSGSKIKINPGIMSPIIFLLSQKYKYIIIDHSDFKKDFTRSVLGVSDIIFPLVKSLKAKTELYGFFDSELKDGQRVYYILNRFYARNIGTFEGGYILEDLEINSKEKLLSELKRIVLSKEKPQIFSETGELITRERTALTIQTNYANSLFLSGFFSSLYEKDIKLDMIYTSSWSYLVAVLYILSKDQKEFEDNILRFFSEEKINSMLEITFPEKYVFKNAKIYNLARSIAGEKRVEHYSVIPVPLLTDRESGARRMFSTGYAGDLFTASFLTDIFEPRKIADSWYDSGYPADYVKPEDLLRTDAVDIRSLSVNNRQKLLFSEKKLSVFYKRYTDRLNSEYRCPAFLKSKNDFFLDVEIDKYNIREILKISREICKDIKQ
ncbi:MAG: hypothetical protein V1874_07230 [Spirochaetota bacterium]